jgi:hypothetical protein
MNKPLHALGAAIAASLSATAAEAATFTAVLKSDVSYSGNGTSSLDISSSTATWSYDTVTGLLSQTGGTFNARFTIVPTYTLFRHAVTGLVIGNGAAASATSFACIEGNFGPGVSASICGNYNFGANSYVLDGEELVPNPFANESSTSWGPGTAFARTIGGDDMILGPQQNLHHPTAGYDGFSLISWVGTTLTLSNATCNPAVPGNANGCATAGGYNTGYTWKLDAGYQSYAPVPAAAWLFGSAMAALGVARHRARKRG